MVHIHVDHAMLEMAEGQIKKKAAELNAKLDELHRGLNQMEWVGDDQAAYRQHQQEWDTAAEGLNNVLNSIGAAVGVARENYITTESSNANLWKS